MTEVMYRSLNKLDAALLRCGYLMDNQMQCPTHATYAIVPADEEAPLEFVCEYHFNLIKIVRTATHEFEFTPEAPKAA